MKQPEPFAAAQTALMVWFSVPLLFLLPPIGAVVVQVGSATIWGLLAMTAFIAVYAGIASRVGKLATGALAWIRRGSGPNAWTTRTLVMVGLPILCFELLARVLRGVVLLWSGAY